MIGRCGVVGRAPPGEPKGLFPARGGLGIAAGAPEPNGLFPARGGLGIAEEAEAVAASDEPVGAEGDSFGASVISFCAFVIWPVNCSRVDSGNCASAASISSAEGAAAFLAAVFFAAAFLAGFGAASTGFMSGNLSINFRRTGASTVDDADRTNSPTSCNFARSSLLSKPSSLANS